MFFCKDEEECISKSKIIISSIPFCQDEKYVKASFSENKIEIINILKGLKDKTLIAGSIPNELYKLVTYSNTKIIDLMKCEELAILNSISTAEGAIQIAMEETNFTIHNSNILILGFGRIGKVLAKMLQAIGANVYCEARKNEDLAWIKTYGYKDVSYKMLDENLGKKDIIINTIPSIVLNSDRLKKVDKNCLIIDLASKPGGVDSDAAIKEGIKVIWALALPGKVAPCSAAKVIKQTIYNEIKDKNMFYIDE